MIKFIIILILIYYIYYIKYEHFIGMKPEYKCKKGDIKRYDGKYFYCDNVTTGKQYDQIPFCSQDYILNNDKCVNFNIDTNNNPPCVNGYYSVDKKINTCYPVSQNNKAYNNITCPIDLPIYNETNKYCMKDYNQPPNTTYPTLQKCNDCVPSYKNIDKYYKASCPIGMVYDGTRYCVYPQSSDVPQSSDDPQSSYDASINELKNNKYIECQRKCKIYAPNIQSNDTRRMFKKYNQSNDTHYMSPWKYKQSNNNIPRVFSSNNFN